MPFHPDILNCCFHVSDNHWKQRFRELAYSDLKVDEKYYYIPVKKERLPVQKFPPHLLSIELLKVFHSAGENSPKEDVEIEEVNDRWSSIKSKNLRESLLMDFAQEHPEESYNVIQTILGNMKLKTVIMKKGKIDRAEFKNVEDKQEKSKPDNNFKRFVKKYQQILTSKYKP